MKRKAKTNQNTGGPVIRFFRAEGSMAPRTIIRLPFNIWASSRETGNLAKMRQHQSTQFQSQFFLEEPGEGFEPRRVTPAGLWEEDLQDLALFIHGPLLPSAGQKWEHCGLCRESYFWEPIGLSMVPCPHTTPCILWMNGTVDLHLFWILWLDFETC
jgi:hypothetical protein